MKDGINPPVIRPTPSDDQRRSANQTAISGSRLNSAATHPRGFFFLCDGRGTHRSLATGGAGGGGRLPLGGFANGARLGRTTRPTRDGLDWNFTGSYGRRLLSRLRSSVVAGWVPARWRWLAARTPGR